MHSGTSYFPCRECSHRQARQTGAYRELRSGLANGETTDLIRGSNILLCSLSTMSNHTGSSGDHRDDG